MPLDLQQARGTERLRPALRPLRLAEVAVAVRRVHRELPDVVAELLREVERRAPLDHEQERRPVEPPAVRQGARDVDVVAGGERHDAERRLDPPRAGVDEGQLVAVAVGDEGVVVGIRAREPDADVGVGQEQPARGERRAAHGQPGRLEVPAPHRSVPGCLDVAGVLAEVLLVADPVRRPAVVDDGVHAVEAPPREAVLERELAVDLERHVVLLGDQPSLQSVDHCRASSAGTVVRGDLQEPAPASSCVRSASPGAPGRARSPRTGRGSCPRRSRARRAAG